VTTPEMKLLILDRMSEQLKDTIENISRYRPGGMGHEQWEKTKKDMYAQLDALAQAISWGEAFLGVTVAECKRTQGDGRKFQ